MRVNRCGRVPCGPASARSTAAGVSVDPRTARGDRHWHAPAGGVAVGAGRPGAARSATSV